MSTPGMSAPAGLRTAWFARMSLRRLVTGGAAIGVVLLAALLLVSLGAERSVQHARVAEARRTQSLQLAYELRQTSDDLTRMARSYVATGDARYRDWFSEILAIRAGTAPRPQDYDGIYWDVVTDTGERPSPFGPPIAFRTLAEQAGFSADELTLLALAQARSDALAQTEQHAFALVQTDVQADVRTDRGYATSTIIIFPLVMYGMSLLSKLQLWTTPLWLVLMVAPFVYLLISHPDSVSTFFAYKGQDGKGGFSVGSMFLAAGVCLSLIAQIAEQIDYLRFMPPKTPENSRRWWSAVILAGPGWVIVGALKQIIGLFLAVYIIGNVADGAGVANQPVHQFLAIYDDIFPHWAALALAVVLVVISQIKINVTNAYSGSLAWTNSYTRVTKHYPGRLVFLGFNLAVALVLMEANMFSFLNTILGFYANCGMSWVVVVASDIVINKYLLGISPKRPEFRRGMLYAVNPVGFGSMLLSAGLSIIAFFGGFGSTLKSYSPLVAIVLALVLPPILAVATGGKYYLRRTDDGIDLPMDDELGNPSGVVLDCHVCGEGIERPDVAACQTHDAIICSLCLSQDRTGEHVLPAQV